MHLKALMLKTSVGNANSALNINAMKSVLNSHISHDCVVRKTETQKTTNNCLFSYKNMMHHVIANTTMKEKNKQD